MEDAWRERLQLAVIHRFPLKDCEAEVLRGEATCPAGSCDTELCSQADHEDGCSVTLKLASKLGISDREENKRRKKCYFLLER